MAGNREVFDAAMSEADSRRWEGQWPEAAQAYQRALAEFPDDLVARGGLGFCYMQTRQWAQALAQYEYVLTRDPGNVIALSKTAEIYAIQGRRPEAFRAYLRLGELYLQQGQSARAEAAWQKAANLAPESPEPHERLANHYRSRKDLAAAVNEYLAAAQAYAAQRDNDRARLHCEEVLRIDPHNAPAHSLLMSLAAGGATARGSEMAHSGEERQAIPEPAMSAKEPGAAPSETDRWAGMMPDVNIPSAGREFPDSATSADSAEQLDARATEMTGRVGSNMGNASTSNSFPGGAAVPPGGWRSGNHTSAPPRRLTAAQISGVLRQAQAFQSQGRLREAIDLCEQIFASGFDRPDARYFLGWLYQEAKQWDAAITHFSRLLNDPDYALSCYYALGQCYASKGDLRTAAQHFDEAVDRVNLDALTIDEVEQLIQLCQETADTHRAIGEIEQGYNVLNALLGFVQSRGWQDRAMQVEQLIRQYQQVTSFMARQTGGRPAPSPAEAAPTMAFSVPSSPSPIEKKSEEAESPVKPSAPAEVAPTMTFPVPPSPAPQGKEAGREAAPTMLPSATEAEPTMALPLSSAAVPSSSPAPPGQEARRSDSPTTTEMVPVEEPAFLDWLTSSPSAPAPATTASTPEATMQPPGMSEAMPAATVQMSPSAQSPESTVMRTNAIQTLDMMAEPLRGQVVQAMADIENYVAHGLLMAATEECMRVIEMVPNYPEVHMKLGEIYERQGKMAQAINKYAMLIDIYRANNRPDEAIDLYRHLLQLEPFNFSYRMQLIALLAALGRRDEEQRERVAVATSYLQLGYIDHAIHEFERLIAEYPTNVAFHMSLAIALMKAGRLPEAVAEYQQILQIDPANVTALARWQIALAGGDNIAAALDILARLIRTLRSDGLRQLEHVSREYTVAMDATPGNALLCYSSGQIQQIAGNYDEAIQLYRQALHKSALEVLTRFAMAQCYLAQGTLPAAQSAVQQLEQAAVAVRHVPVDPAIWLARPRNDTEEHQAPEIEIALLLAQAYRQTGQIEQMQALLQQIKRALPYRDELQSGPAAASARRGEVVTALAEYQELVRRHRANRQVEKAIVVLQEMTRLAPDEAGPHVELGDIYINWGLLEEGLAELRTVATIHLRHGQNEEAARVLQRIAAVYWDMGNREEALDTYRRVIELIPQDMQARMDIVRCCLQCGLRREAAEHQSVVAHHYFATQQTKDAVASLQQLIAMDRSNYEAYDLLGQTYAMAGEYEQAARVYRNLMKVDPDNAIAQQRLAELLELRSRNE